MRLCNSRVRQIIVEMKVYLGVAQSKSVTGHIPTTGIKKESITVVGDSLPKGTEGTVC